MTLNFKVFLEPFLEFLDLSVLVTYLFLIAILSDCLLYFRILLDGFDSLFEKNPVEVWIFLGLTFLKLLLKLMELDFCYFSSWERLKGILYGLFGFAIFYRACLVT